MLSAFTGGRNKCDVTAPVSVRQALRHRRGQSSRRLRHYTHGHAERVSRRRGWEQSEPVLSHSGILITGQIS
jgi:hypothetical protein